jgi:hypothetical protein
MLRLLIKNIVPKEGWRYTHQGTGTVLRAKSWNELMDRVKKYRNANGIPLGKEFEEQLGSEVCSQEGWGSPMCEEQDWPITVKNRQIGVFDVVNFLKVLKHWLVNRPEFVGQEEAETRAAICASCPHNVEVSGCLGCTNVARLIMEAVNDRKTSQDQELKNCRVCGCVNKAQVWVPKETLAQGVTAEMREAFPDHCWKK